MTLSHLRKSLLFFALLIFVLAALGYNGNTHFVMIPAGLPLWVVSDLLGVPPLP
jgi:hypothetical protein